MKKEAYVYIHTRLDNNEVFYVGIGRLKDYKRAYQTKKSRNPFWHNIVKKTKYEVSIVADNLQWEEACRLEILLIKKYGRKDLHTGTLVNLTDGGDGNKGMSKEQKDKISNSLKGRVQTDETKLKRSNTLKEVWKNQDLIELKRKQTKELNILGVIGTKGKPSLKKGVPLSQEQKDKISNSLSEYYKANKPHNFKKIDEKIQHQILNDFKNGIKKFALHKRYNLDRKIIERILKNENQQ